MFDLIIFDCDGTLVDTESVSNQLLTNMLVRLGLPYTVPRTVERFLGRSGATNRALIAEELGRPLPDGAWEEMMAEHVAVYEQRVDPMPHVPHALAQIRQPKCVASSSGHHHLNLVLRQAGVLAHFAPHIFSAVEVAHGKPAPDLFLHAAARMGVVPDRCAVIEDSPAGVQAGVAAGMTVFGYHGPQPHFDLAAHGARVFDDMRQLPGLLA